MSNQVNKVDLSLDDIIKLNRKQKQQSRGGASSSRGRGATRGTTRGNLRGRGQGMRGQKASPAQGAQAGNRLKNKKANLAGGVKRGQSVGLRGQRANLRGQVRVRGRGGRGGGLSTRGGAAGRLSTNAFRSAGARGGLASAAQGVKRGAGGNIRGTLRGRGGRVNRGRGRGSALQGQRVGLQSQGQRAAAVQGQKRQGQAGAQGRVSLRQKRDLAVAVLQKARATIAQLDQQSARQNLFNQRRGITPVQQAGGLVTASMRGKKRGGMYSSNVSLQSTSSQSSLASGRQLMGTQVTAFTSPSQPVGKANKKRAWRARSQAPVTNDAASSLTISFDNTPSFIAPQAPQASTAPAPVGRGRGRRQWQRQNNSNPPRNDGDSVDMNRGATPGFAQQLAKLKPTSSTKYVFQKRAFSTGNTTSSLNDRFSNGASEDPMGRKVFM